MLRNKYVIAAIGGLLVLVAAYNIAFFSKSPKSGSPAVSKTPAIRNGGARSTSPAASSTGEDYAPKWTRDPFWYPRGSHHRTPVGKTAAKRGSGIVLEATMSKDGSGSALVNGKIVELGETIGGVVVVEIGSRYIKVKGHEGIKTIFLKSGIPGEDT